MIRLLVLAVSAMMAVSAGAASAAELTVRVVGKPTQQVHADLAAAKSVCKEDLAGTNFASELMPFCIREVTRDAVKKVASPELTAYDRANGRQAYLVKVSR